MHQPVPYQHPGPMQVQRNPEGWSAFGAVAGVMAGGLAGGLLSLAFKPSSIAEAVADSADAATAAADVQAQALLQAFEKWNRMRHILSGIGATLGSAGGAYLGAAPHQKRNAAIGAAIGTGAMRSLNVIFNPIWGLPGLVAGGVGAYVGAKRADRGGGGGRY